MLGLSISLSIGSQNYTGTVTPSTYLPTVTSSPMVVVGARRMVSGYNGPLFRLQRSSDSTQSDFAAAVGDLPSYSAINTWGGASTLTVVKAYDQSGNARDMTTTGGTIGFDTTLLAAGCAPFQLITSGYFSHTAGSAIYDNRNSSYFEVCQYRSAAEQAHSILFDFYNGTAVTHSAFLIYSGSSSFNATDGRTIFSPSICPRTNLSAFGVTANASGQTLFCRETTSTAAAATAATATTFRIGFLDSPSYLGTRSSWGSALYPALTNTDSNTVLTALRTMQSVPTSFTSRIVFEGDSIMDGKLCTNNSNLVTQMSLNGTPELFNLGVSGEKLADDYTIRTTLVEPLYTTAYGAGKCVLVLQAGVNDLAGSTTASALYTTLTNFVSAEKTVGFKVVVSDILPVTTGNFSGLWTSTVETQRVSYNTSVTGNAAAADQVVDIANTGTTMGALSAPSNASLYPDGLHPSTLGYSNLAPEYAAKLNLLV